MADARRAVEAARAAAEVTDLREHAEAVLLAVVDPALVPQRGATHYGVQRAVREAWTVVDAALMDEPLVADVVRLRPQIQITALQVDDRPESQCATS